MHRCALFFLFIFFNIQFSQAALHTLHNPPSTLQAEVEIKKNVQAQVAFIKQCKQQTKFLSECIVKQLSTLTRNIDYWKQQKLEPFSYFIARGPLKWFSSVKQYEEVDSCISFLTQEHERLAYFLGKMNYCCERLELYINTPLLTKKLLQLLLLIQNCIHVSSFEKTPVQDECSLEAIYSLYQQNQNQLSYFDTQFQRHIYPYTMPGHIRRNWLSYTLLATAAAFAVRHIQTNPESSKAVLEEQLDYMKQLIDTRIILPIKTAWDILFQFPEETPEDFEKHKQIYSDNTEKAFSAFEEFCIDYNKNVHPNRPEPEIQSDIEEARDMGVPQTIYDDWIKNAQHPVWNIPFGTSGKLTHLQALLFMYKIAVWEEKLHEISKAVSPEQHSITRAFIMAGPLLFGIYGVGHVTKKLITKFIPVDRSHQEVQKIIHIIHRMVNTSNMKNKHSNHVNNGLIIHQVSELKKLASHIDIKLRAGFIEDCKQLASFDLTREQKLIAIEQMYRRYHFLTML